MMSTVKVKIWQIFIIQTRTSDLKPTEVGAGAATMCWGLF